MTAKHAVVALIKDLSMERLGNIDTTLVEYHVVLSHKVGVASQKSLTPLGVLSESLLEALKEF
jgi:hypothetical protein